MGWTHLCSSLSKRWEEPAEKKKSQTSNSSQLIILAHNEGNKRNDFKLRTETRMRDLWLIKKFKRRKNQKSLPVSFLTHDLQTLAHVENKVKKDAFLWPKMRKTSTVADIENRGFYRKSLCDSPAVFNSNESKSVTCT